MAAELTTEQQKVYEEWVAWIEGERNANYFERGADIIDKAGALNLTTRSMRSLYEDTTRASTADKNSSAPDTSIASEKSARTA
jgi:hypothetical protein